MNKKAVNVELLRGFVNLIKAASEFIEKQAEREERVASQIPSVVDGLVDRGLIDSIDREKTAKMLLNHEECLKAVKVASAHVASPSTLGSPVSVKSASTDRVSGYAQTRESDLRFEQAILS